MKPYMKKYTTMPINQILTRSALVLATLFVFNPAHADNLKDIAQLADQGQQAAALDRINAYITANPKDVQALFIKGVILAEQNRRDEAIKVFTEITEKSPNLPEPYNNLAVLYADQGQYDKARKALESAIKTHPSYATAHENLGDIYARMASEAYDKALQLDSSNTRAQNKLALIRDLFSSSKKTLMAAAKPAAGATAVAAAKPATKPVDTTKPEVKTPTKTTNVDPEDPANAKAMAKAGASTTKPSTSTTASGNDEIVSSVQNWAKAWSDKNLDAYFESYSETFAPPKGDSRSAWEKMRRERINKPGNISVDLSNIVVSDVTDSSAKVSFKQNYKSASLSQRTNKVLNMKKVNGKWLIEREIADK
jgi:tetratricopeptide (TPR) repeat protein